VIRNIHIGIIGKNHGWEQILTQIGVSWSRMHSAAAAEVQSQSCIIACRQLDRDELSVIDNYISRGGAVVDTLGQLISQQTVNRHLSTVYPGGDSSLFSHIEEIVINHRTAVHPLSDQIGGLAWLDPTPKRSLAFLSLPVHLLADPQPLIHTQFRSSELPAVAERTAARSSGPYIEACLTVLKKLHSKSGVPFVHKWWMPDTDRQLATFRIDSDYGTREAISLLGETITEFDISATWFLHTEAHENWLEHFKKFSGHEIALHCNRHTEFKTSSQYTADIHVGLQLLRRHGYNPEGYASPYGYWGPELSAALSHFNFRYSSEFGYDYDSLPSRPRSSLTMQLPVHPISIGSFRRFKFKHGMIENYFDELMRLKQLQHQPFHLYHHPCDGHESILRTLFGKLKHESVRWMSYSDWASWWNNRKSGSLNAAYDTELKTVRVEKKDGLPMAVHHSENSFLISEKPTINLEQGRFTPYIEPELVKLVNQRQNGDRLSQLKMKKDRFMTYLWRNRV